MMRMLPLAQEADVRPTVQELIENYYIDESQARVYAGKRFVIHALQADSSRATTAAAVSP